ncbi:hypothetical protein KIL84_013063 [Mauremys mutica]|uniref:Uncharacterized protein n=1 Tax=Mauremys mutica TaxID=74926 RepID=A0A9D3XS95_9SAUR|nr:hypothetical protein KIL84_013063 [Mauremys mutica]
MGSNLIPVSVCLRDAHNQFRYDTLDDGGVSKLNEKLQLDKMRNVLHISSVQRLLTSFIRQGDERFTLKKSWTDDIPEYLNFQVDSCTSKITFFLNSVVQVYPS